MNAPYWPRLMKRATAAAYCDLATAKFLQEVATGRLSPPIKMGGEDHWDRDALDQDINRIAGRSSDWRKDQPGLAA
jgi:hypothetical protein